MGDADSVYAGAIVGSAYEPNASILQSWVVERVDDLILQVGGDAVTVNLHTDGV